MNLVQPRQTRSFVALLSSAFSAAAASALLITVLGKQVFDLTGRARDLGLLGLAEFAPAALLVFVTGPLADRVDRRRLAATGLTLQAVSVAGLAWYAGTHPTSTVPIFVLVVAFGASGAFATPAIRALPPDIVVPERLPWLIARQTVMWQAASIVGPIVGGFLYVAKVRLPYAVSTLLLVLGAVAILFVQPLRHAVRPPRTRGGLREAVEGVRFVRSQPFLLGAISLDLFAVLFGGAVALLPAIATTRFGVGAVGLGLLRAAIGLGAGAVTLFIAVRARGLRVGRGRPALEPGPGHRARRCGDSRRCRALVEPLSGTAKCRRLPGWDRTILRRGPVGPRPCPGGARSGQSTVPIRRSHL